jgi:alpha-glucuronidase
MTPCTAKTKFDGVAGWYEIDVEYFDLNDGVAKFRVFVGDQLVDEWNAERHLPGRDVSADESVRRRIKGVALRPGDEIRIEGVADKDDKASLDYIEIIPMKQ